MTRDSAEDVDYQLGVSDIDTSASLSDSDDIVEFTYEAAAVFKRLADDIYSSTEAGIREPLMNAITTVRQARNQGYEDAGTISITLERGEGNVLRLRDTGMGITNAVLEQVLTVIGRSTERDNGNMSGMYGMGFLASYKLVGMDGGFLICSNPRETDDGPYSGLFKPGTYDPDVENKLPVPLDEDEYGTIFEYYLEESIDVDSIRDWVEKHARWSPVPVIYRELDEDGSLCYDDEFGSQHLGEKYDDESPVVSVENQYLEAACSPSADSDIVLISSPVRTYGKSKLSTGLPWQVDVRLKYENGIVINGPHEGLIPVSDQEYEMKDDEKYMRESELSEDDVRLPEPTGTRERVRKNYEFMNYVNGLLVDKYQPRVRQFLSSFENDIRDYASLSTEEREFLDTVAEEYWEEQEKYDKEYSVIEIQESIERRFDYSITDEFAEFLQALTSRVTVISDEKGGRSYPSFPAITVEGRGEDTYMTLSGQSWKIDAIEASDEDTNIVRVEDKSDYQKFSKTLGWGKVKDIKKSGITDQLDITKDSVERVTDKSIFETSTDNSPISEQTLSVHYSSGGRSTVTRRAGEMKEKFRGTEPSGNYRLDDALIVFTTTGDENISDHYNLADNAVSLVNCSKKIAEYLIGPNNTIFSLSGYKEWVRSKTLTTSYGKRTIDSCIDLWRTTVLHIPENGAELLKKPEAMSKAVDVIEEKYDVGAALYAVLDKSEKHWCTHFQNVYSDANQLRVMSSSSFGNLNVRQYHLDAVRFYCQLRLPEKAVATAEVDAMCQSLDSLTPDAISAIETLIEARNHQDFTGFKPDNDGEQRLPDLTSRHGKISLEDAYRRADRVVIHPLPKGVFKSFNTEDILSTDVSECLSEIPTGWNSDRLPDVSDEDVLYTIIPESDTSWLVEHIDSTRTLVLERSSGIMCGYNVDYTDMYLALCLPNWVGTSMFDVLTDMAERDTMQDIATTFKPLHNSGRNPVEIDSLENIRVSKN